MSTNTARMAGSSMLLALVLLAPVAVPAGEYLTGHKIKDVGGVLPGTVITMGSGFSIGTCELKKAKFALLSSANSIIADDPRGGQVGDFVCYIAKCTHPDKPTIPANTVLGDHVLETKKTQLVCLPMDSSLCGDNELDPGEECDGSDSPSCPGACEAFECTCAPCPDGGERVGGACWYLSDPAGSCTATCSALGLSCAAATVSYAGSGGIDANCSAVLSALYDMSMVAAGLDCTGFGDPIGCSVPSTAAPGNGVRCTAPVTTCGAAETQFTPVRACACE